MTERRQFYRWNFSLPCSFQWENGTGEGEVSNISYGGLCIQKASSIPAKGTTLEVTLQLGQQYSCELEARVVYTRPSPVGDSTFGVAFNESNLDLSRHPLSQILETFLDDRTEKIPKTLDADR